MTLRCATNDDSESVRRLIFAVLEEYGLSPDPAGTDADLGDIEGNYRGQGGGFWVLTDRDGKLVGTVGLYPLKGGDCELRKMYLTRNHRGKGWGRKLAKLVLRQARTRGFCRMKLETAKVLVEAISLYEDLGFSPLSEAPTSGRCDRVYALDLRELSG